MAGIAACDQPSADTNTIVNPAGSDDHLLTDTKPPDTTRYSDTSVMVIDSMSHVTFNSQPVDGARTEIYYTVYNSWLQDYSRTGHLPVYFKFVQLGTVTMGIRGDVGDDMLKAQKDMKDYIAKDKYHKPFEQLDAALQDSMKMAHPILFKRPF